MHAHMPRLGDSNDDADDALDASAHGVSEPDSHILPCVSPLGTSLNTKDAETLMRRGNRLILSHSRVRHSYKIYLFIPIVLRRRRGPLMESSFVVILRVPQTLRRRDLYSFLSLFTLGTFIRYPFHLFIYEGGSLSTLSPRKAPRRGDLHPSKSGSKVRDISALGAVCVLGLS
jgi:hypothetical protein